MRIVIPTELAPYIRLRDGEIIFKQELPEALCDIFEAFRKEYEEAKKHKEPQIDLS